MKKTGHTDAILGVCVSGRSINAVLVEKQESGPVVLGQFARDVAQSPQALGSAAVAGMVPELQEQASGADFTLEFGDGSGSDDMFLPAELGDDVAGEGESEQADAHGSTIEAELNSILKECASLGVARPAVVFCLGSGNVAHVALRVPENNEKDGGKDGSDKGAARVKRSQLLDLLKNQHRAELDPEAVAFLPMTPGADKIRRFLALVPKAEARVEATVRAMRETPESLPNIRGMEAEVSVLLGLARTVVGSEVGASDEEDESAKNTLLVRVGREVGASEEEDESAKNTLLVRVGREDTLVQFLHGSSLIHVENLRSLTSFDSPETVCSRLLLQQDEQSIDEIDHVLILGEAQEEGLVESFRMFYPDADVRSLRRYLPDASGDDDGETEVNAVAALGAALRHVDAARQPFFDDVNMLPKRLLRPTFRMPFGWTSIALVALILVTAVFFVGRYVSTENEIDTYRERLRAYPPKIETADTNVLQARIDSMREAYSGYMHALTVLDSLLVGSDRWSRGLEALSDQAASVRGVWVESWHPAGGDAVEIQGSATNRNRVVNLADRLNGSIQSLTFAEIREKPVYEYRMQVPVPELLPEAAEYLRHQVDLDETASSDWEATSPPVAPASHVTN